MMNKTEFLASVETEIGICKHLYGKVTASSLAYCPGENMRTLPELLNYLTVCASVSVEAMVKNDWSVVGPHDEKSKELKPEDFLAAMDAQLAKIHALLETVSDDDLANKEAVFPWGGSTKLGLGLINLPLKFLAAYRLQLFLYLKASGSTELNTMNAWLGSDAPPLEH